MSWDAIADADMIERLTAENARLRGEVEAYKRAKAENDEALADLARVTGERDAWEQAGVERSEEIIRLKADLRNTQAEIADLRAVHEGRMP